MAYLKSIENDGQGYDQFAGIYQEKKKEIDVKYTTRMDALCKKYGLPPQDLVGPLEESKDQQIKSFFLEILEKIPSNQPLPNIIKVRHPSEIYRRIAEVERMLKRKEQLAETGRQYEGVTDILMLPLRITGYLLRKVRDIWMGAMRWMFDEAIEGFWRNHTKQTMELWKFKTLSYALLTLTVITLALHYFPASYTGAFIAIFDLAKDNIHELASDLSTFVENIA